MWWFRKFVSSFSLRRTRRRRSAGWRRDSEVLEPRLLLTFDLLLDYSFDSGNFFADQERRDVLEAAAQVLEGRITDDLDAIVPTAEETWTGVFNNPSSGLQVTVSNPTVPADTVIIYVGARDMNGGLGLGGPAGFETAASPAFNQTLQTRGEPGVVTNSNTDTDFAPWGGTLAIDTAANWNFSLNPPEPGQNDLFTVAVHEMAHVLGFGLSESFVALRSGLTFTGSTSTEVFGGPVPLHTDQVHVASNTTSTLPGSSITQESLFDPQITTGTRKLFTDLDWALLDDIGWDIGPEPAGFDYGDAPDSLPGNGPSNYSTRIGDDGPSHTIGSDVYIGPTPPDRDIPLIADGSSLDDFTDTDDEGFTGSDFLGVVLGAENNVAVDVTNNTAGTATLYGWIDFDLDGIFEASEQASVTVPPGTSGQEVTLTFAAAGNADRQTVAASYARFRLSTDGRASSPVGSAANGEVEDHPVVLYPPSRAHDSLPSFTWQAIPSAVSYEVEVDNLTTGESRVLVESFIPAGSGTIAYRAPTAFAPGAYRWRFRGFDGTEFLPFSGYATFHVFETSETPFLTDPVASAVDSLPTFAWSPVADAVRYELWVDNNDAAGKKRAVHQTSLTRTSFTPKESLAVGEYSAWVRSFDSAGTATAWSERFPFTISPATGPLVELTDPIGTTTNTTPTIAWKASSGTPPVNSPLLYTVSIVDSAGTTIVRSTGIEETHFVVPEALLPGDYTAFVSSNATDVSTAIIPEISFRVAGVSGQADITAPFGNSENPVPLFSWTNVTGANRYEIWVNDVTNGRSRIIGDSRLTGTSFQTLNPLAPGLYRVWVRAFEGATPIGGWSEPVDFRVTEASDTPTIWSPSGSTRNTLPTFVWSDVAGTVAAGNAPLIRVELFRDGERVLQSQTSEYNRPFANYLTPEEPLLPGEYRLQLTNFFTAFPARTATTTFVIESSPGEIEVLSPYAQTHDTRPPISWPAVDGATRYFVWVNDLTRNVTGAILENNVTRTALIPEEPLLPGDYRVWVRAYNGTTPVSGWSAASDFTVTASNEPPVITSPLFETANNVPTFTWTAVSDAASYEIQIEDSGGTPVGSGTSTTTAFRPGFAIPQGNYIARVRSVDSNGVASEFGPDNQFRIEAAANAVLTSPLAGSSASASDVFFAWTSVEGAERYELWVSNLDTGQRVIHETTLTSESYTPPTLLNVGSYRAWVRAIGRDGLPDVWSVGFDFSVV